MDELRKLLDTIMSEGLDKINSLTDDELRLVVLEDKE